MTASADLRDELAPEFELVRVLGEGSMATVHLAREAALERLVAIKVLRPELADDETARRRFEREARSAARIQHPHVAAMHRVAALSDGTPYLVMEYVEGSNLADALAADTVTPAAACSILRQMSQALAEAHDHGIVHRDVRPPNIIWDADHQRAVLTDFGIAAVLETGGEPVTRLTRSGQILGDPTFSSPEQLLSEPLTGAADVYSLGVLGYQLLAGRGPYEAATRAAMTTAHLRQEPRRLTDLDPEADPTLARVLERALSKKPAQRPRAADLARKLEALERGEGDGLDEEIGPFPLASRFVREFKRRRMGAVVWKYGVFVGVMVGLAEPFSSQFTGSEDLANRLIVRLTLLSYPVVLVVAWMYDLTSRGIRRSEADPEMEGQAGLRLLEFGLLALTVVVVVAIGWFWFT